MVIYVSHPYEGNEINRLKVESIIHELIKKYPNNTFISPIHTFLFAYDFYPYEQGLEMCFRLLDKCDEMIVCGDWKSSRGCTAEVKYAEENGIPYHFLGEQEE